MLDWMDINFEHGPPLTPIAMSISGFINWKLDASTSFSMKLKVVILHDAIQEFLITSKTKAKKDISLQIQIIKEKKTYLVFVS